MIKFTHIWINSCHPTYLAIEQNHSTEQCLIILIEVWKRALDTKNIVGAVLTDLSKAFDCLNLNLLIAKLDVYGFDKSAVQFKYDYLKERKQRTRVSNSYSSCLEIVFAVPQGSFLGPLLFNIFINGIFYFIDKTKIANYADDYTTYASEKHV